MDRAPRHYVQVMIDEMDTVVFDPKGHYDAEVYDRFASFEQARDAALCCIEDVLEEGDHDGEAHKVALEAMIRLLEASGTFDDLAVQPEYRRLLERFAPARPSAA